MIEENKLIKTEIKGRQITYYLTTKEDLINLKSNSLVGDIFAILASLSIGGIISVVLTRATGIKLQSETLNVLNILLYIFVLVAIIFGFFTAFFYIKTYKIIDNIQESGEVKSLKSFDINESGIIIEAIKDGKQKTNKLEILKATYWTPNKSLDVTNELRALIIHNKLEVVASNKIKGDPEYGVGKKLTIVYIYYGITITKEYNEWDKIVIP